MDWRYASCSRALTLQAWSLEFKCQYHQKKKTEKKKEREREMIALLKRTQNINGDFLGVFFLYFEHSSCHNIKETQNQKDNVYIAWIIYLL
jgi:hypothetical protein